MCLCGSRSGGIHAGRSSNCQIRIVSPQRRCSCSSSFWILVASIAVATAVALFRRRIKIGRWWWWRHVHHDAGARVFLPGAVKERRRTAVVVAFVVRCRGGLFVKKDDFLFAGCEQAAGGGSCRRGYVVWNVVVCGANSKPRAGIDSSSCGCGCSRVVAAARARQRSASGARFAALSSSRCREECGAKAPSSSRCSGGGCGAFAPRGGQVAPKLALLVAVGITGIFATFGRCILRDRDHLEYSKFWCIHTKTKKGAINA